MTPMEYCPIDTEVLVRMSPLRADVYIRLNEEKFLKLFRAGDEFTDGDLARWRDQKHIEHLYLRAEDSERFVEQLNAELDEKLREAPGPESEPDLESVRHSQQAVMSAVQSLPDAIGVSKGLQDAVRKQVALTFKSIRFHWKMSGILKQLSDAGGYLAAHSMALSYVANLILSKTQWAGELNGQKLCFSALMHDIMIKNQKLALVESLAELEARKDEFSEDERKSYHFHTIRSAERIALFDAIPPDVNTIVMQHHERPDGTGFPRHLKYPQITPLSAVFIVAHEMVSYARKRGKAFEVSEFLPTVEGMHEGHFSHVIEAIQFE